MRGAQLTVALFLLSAVSFTLAQGPLGNCVPITGTSPVCSLPASTCTTTGSSVDGTTYSLAGYTALWNSWAAQKTALCPNKPYLVDDYPLGEYCPDACTSNYTCQANQYTNLPNYPMCYHLCQTCFDGVTCTGWANNYANVTRSGIETGCYASWTHKGYDTLQINNVVPTWGYLKGNQRVVITGCGFTTYSEATCVWGNWHSTHAIIVDDNTIHCWTPTVSFITVPTTTTFTIIFDGTPAISRTLPNFWWGPMITGVSPSNSYVAGGGTLTISGFGFSEYNSSTVVMIDAAVCGSPSVTDSAITCTIPAGLINQNAIINIFFSGWKYYYLHSNPWTLHYGPILTSINPTCGHVLGGDAITLSGTLFDDPVLNNPRVEFFINGNWYYGSSGSHSGTNVVVTTPYPPGGIDLWDQNIQLVVYGGVPTFASYTKVPGVTSFHYGALMFSVSPTVGYIDGGDSVSITGCAFRDYNVTQINVVYGGATNLCAAGTTTIVNDNLITCTSVASTACYTQPPVTITLPLSRSLPTPTQIAAGVGFKWTWGPVIFPNTLTPSRGPWSVSTTVVTVTGYKIGRSASTQFSTPICTWQALPSSPTTAATVSSQTTLTCTVPAYTFNQNTPVGYSFEAPCTAQNFVSPQYHYGPLCTSITPTFGFIGGGVGVTINGVGFQDVDWNNKVIKARWCVTAHGPCNWEQDTVLTVSSTNVATTTTPGFALAPRNGLGANRYFGESATVSLFFDTVGVNETDTIACTSYRYGPIVTGTTPRKGPIGPVAAHSPNTQVQISGVGFSDPLVTKNIRVAFGPIHGEGAVTSGDTSITVLTLWGARANTDKSVYVYFDTCNTTVSSQVWSWGPMAYNASPIWGYNAYQNNVVTIRGVGFEEWLLATSYTEAICVIDNVYGTNTAIVTDPLGGYMITCTVPDRPFGTQAPVQVVFGHNCRGQWDWTQVLTVPNDIYYTPNITGISPTFGYTSGGQTVTVSGFGLGGWVQYYCFFGHYLGTVQTAPVNLNDPVICQTPTRRADFNTDVLVHIQLSNGTQVQSAGFERKVWGPTYHYGPICSSLSPSFGYTNPGPSYQVVLNGGGFQDTHWFNSTTPYVLFNGVNVTVGTTSDSTIAITGIQGGNCLSTKTVSIWWDFPTQTISCPLFTHGPRVFSSAPNLGWAGDTVTVTGDFMDDVQLYTQLTNVAVVFGTGGAGTTTSVSKTSVTVTAPTNAWLYDPTLVVRWTGANLTCVQDSVLVANDFHYGPIITSIAPTFGYVYGRQPVVITGAGFTCCGLDTTQTHCRFGHNEISAQDGTTTTVSSTTINCFSIGRSPPEITGSSNAVTTKVVGMRFNATSYNLIIDTDTSGLPRQPLVTYYYGPLVTAVSPTFGRIRGSTTLVITGAGFQDPFFNNVPLLNPAPQVNFTPLGTSQSPWVQNTTGWTDSSITVSTPAWVHHCGDPLDVIAISFYVNTSTTDRFIIPTNNQLTHYYGPVISSISATRGYIKGGDSVTINISELDEWYTRQAKILFANREINGQNYPVAAEAFSVTTPVGSWAYSGNVYVILDPKNDALTTLQYWWHWIPYTTSLSISWGVEGGNTIVSVYGGGFCEYELVQCSFGGALGMQSDVAYDDRVVCQSPMSAPAGSSISLTFCDFWNDCFCTYDGSADVVPAPAFTFTGITGIAPVSGPWVGGTTVTFTGSGFTTFSSISVAFGSLSAVGPSGNSTTPTQFVVVTPASPASQAVQVFVTFTYSFSDGQTQTFTFPDRSSDPINFHYEYPYIEQIAPTTTDVDTSVDVTLTGDYFNGGSLSVIKCVWTLPGVASALVITPKAQTLTTLTCTAPSYGNGVVMLGGAAVQVTFDGTRKSNMMVFQYTQNPSVTSISPTSGPQYGATSVTVFGANFNAGISVLCKFGTQLIGANSVNINGGTTGSTSGTTNGTTGGSTTGSANSTAQHYPQRRSPRGANDNIVCYSPRTLANSFPDVEPVEVSLDGGVTWTNNGIKYSYQSGFTSTSEQATAQATSATTNAGVTASPVVAFVFALVLLVALL